MARCFMALWSVIWLFRSGASIILLPLGWLVLYIFHYYEPTPQAGIPKGLFGRSVVDLGLSKIQNISYNVPGFTGEALGFGTIVLQTYVGDLVLDKVHHPGKIYNKIQDAVVLAGGDVDGEIDG